MSIKYYNITDTNWAGNADARVVLLIDVRQRFSALLGQISNCARLSFRQKDTPVRRA